MFELFIAKRYLKSKRKLNFITIISILSMVGITIGVAALIIVLAVFNGFGSLVTNTLTSFDPHLRINVLSDKLPDNFSKLESELDNNKEVISSEIFVEGKAIFINNKTYEIVNLKGLEQLDDNWGVGSKIIFGDGDIKTSNYDISKIIIGMPIALKLSLRIGDTLTITSAHNLSKSAISLSLPPTKRFLVTGIFETHNKEYDYGVAFTDLETAKSLHGFKNGISGIELRLNNEESAEELKENLSGIFPEENYSFYTWHDLHKDLYTVMLLERWAAYILLCLIICVATFNILGSLSMTVIEKRKDISVMRSMGVPLKSIKRIFLYEGLIIGVLGTIAGTLIGLGVCFLQINFNIYPLDPLKYIINSLPVELRFFDIIAISSMSLLLSFLAALYPARKAVKDNIIEAIKWE